MICTNIILVHQTPLIVNATNLFDSNFFVNELFAVYKVIENDNATASSTVEPTSTSNSIFETSDV